MKSIGRSFTAGEHGKNQAELQSFQRWWDVYFRIGRVLGCWIWHVEEVNAWGLTFSQAEAKARARASILQYRPNLAEFRLEQMSL